MIRLSAIRRQGISRGRHVLGLFVAAWMAIILQPCAVADETEHDCPHCPPEMTHEGHQQALTSPDCEIGDQIALEARSLQPKLDDSFIQMPVFLGQAYDEIKLSPGSNHAVSKATIPIFPSGPPLNVLNCVYLK